MRTETVKRAHLDERARKHPRLSVLREMLHSLAIPDAGFVLHLLDCPRCAEVARKALAPKPIRRHRRKAAEEQTALEEKVIC